MTPTKTQQALEKFYVDELIRYYRSQERHEKSYLKALLQVWKLNSNSGPYQRAYKQAVREIESENTN